MSVDAFPISLADEVALSVLCQNSLTDAEVKLARAAFKGLDPAWSLDCCESCEGDWFLDLSAAWPGGRFDRFIIHARDAAIHVFAMAGDDHVPLGCFADMAQAARAAIAAIAANPANPA
jgi:hypothetical protein